MRRVAAPSVAILLAAAWLVAGSASAQRVSSGVRLTRIGNFYQPSEVVAPPGDLHHLFVVEKVGTVQVLVDGRLQRKPFLDVKGLLNDPYEGGLLSLAFAPDYARSGRFFIFYTDRAKPGNSVIAEYRRSSPVSADPSSARRILFIRKRAYGHFGGMLQFGRDGYLYVSVGDGSEMPASEFAYQRKAQSLNNLFGKVLRIDPRHGSPYSIPVSNPFAAKAGARGEIWDYGLRNPWRFWIDPPTGDMYISDVGASAWEEVDYVRGNRSGLNFGWPCFEGTRGNDSSITCSRAVPPTFEYPHARGRCAIVGGVVARDSRLPSLRGRYLYVDLCSGEIRSVRIASGKAADDRSLGLTVKEPTSFGVDAAGRIYVASVPGPVYRLDPAR
jgi:glucose/arabinose dehydrogenase